MCTIALREVAEFLAGQTLSVDAETVTFAMHFPRCVPPRCGVMRARVGPGAHAVRAFVLFCAVLFCLFLTPMMFRSPHGSFEFIVCLRSYLCYPLYDNSYQYVQCWHHYVLEIDYIYSKAHPDTP